LNPTQLYNMRVEELIRIQKQAVSEWGALEGGWDEEQMAALETAGAAATTGAAAVSAYAGAASENTAASLASDRRTTADLFRADASAFSVDALLRESQAQEAQRAAEIPARSAEAERQPVADATALKATSAHGAHGLEEKAAPLRELSDEDYEKLFGLINRGMLNAGQVLSQLLGVRVDVSVPEIKTMDYNQLDKYVPRGSLLAAAVEAETGIDAIVLLIFDESTGYRAAGDLMGLAADQWGPQGISLEDLRSVLCELINIVGAGILNELSNRTGITMTPSVPDFFAGEHPDVMRWIDSRETAGKGLKILYITADFFRQDLEFLGRLFLIPSSQSLARVVNKL
jgi:chemotaxis protein CheY-P-specific phosphatase CheC